MGEYPSGMETSGVHARGKLSQREKGLELESFLFLPEYPPPPPPRSWGNHGYPVDSDVASRVMKVPLLKYK